MIIRNMKEADQALLPYVPLVGQLLGKDVTLERIVPLMKLLDNPQDKLKVIHIAGTSGKTSTAYYMAGLLQAAGKKIGLTVSPHVDSVAERVQIDGRPLTEKEFCGELGKFLDIIDRAAQPPTYFELLYAFSLWVFAEKKVDYAVVETGMGGLYDATNVVTRPDKVCVITDIGFDHVHILGKTLAAITAQKIGIVHEHNHVFMYEQDEEIMQVVHKWCGEKQAPLHLVARHALQRMNPEHFITMPEYQRRNWLLALYVYRYVEERDYLPHLTSQVLRETQARLVPARMETIKVGGKTVIMDGAHNAQKMTAFIESFHGLYPGVKPAVLLGLKDGKEYTELVTLLTGLAGRIITTMFNTTQDLPVRAMDPEILAEVLGAGGLVPVQSIAHQGEAFKALLAAPEDICIITGSFYLLSQLRGNEQLA